MDIIVTKNHEMFGKIRILEKDGEPWFVLADVCKALELEQVSRVAVRLNPDGVTKIKGIENSGFGERKIELNIINEMNLYKCILRSNKPEAEKFQEAYEDYLDIEEYLQEFWKGHCRKDTAKANPHLMDILDRLDCKSECLVKEAVQIAAVVKKIKAGELK